MSSTVATPCVLLKFGELALKGRNQWRFVAGLVENTESALSELGALELRRRQGVLAVVADGGGPDLLERARDVIGVSLLHPALIVDRDPELALAAALELLEGRSAQSFAVRARRRDKRFPLRSQELAARIGRGIQERLGLRVDLDHPDVEVHLEVDNSEIFVYTDRIRGRGGLPVGLSGRALVLLSGGIDSPVAAYRAMKRGLRCDFVHFSGAPHTGPESTYKAYAQVGRLDRFQGRSRLYVVRFGPAQRQLAAAGAGRLQVLAQRRLMVRTGCALARREGAEALVTGDSLGQVASQTLTNLHAVEDASELPLLRPLVTLDKAEIVEEARALETLEAAEVPAEDCCELFMPRRAETRANVERLRRLDRGIDAERLAEQLASEAELVLPADDPASAAA